MQNIKEIEDYIVAHSDAEPKFLQRLDRATHFLPSILVWNRGICKGAF